MINRSLTRLRALPHSRNIIINTVGTYLGFVFSAIYIVFFVRVLSPAEFGLLSVLQAFSYLLTNILSFGMPASVYAHLPSHRHSAKELSEYIFSNILVMTVLSGLSLALLYAWVHDIDSHFLRTHATDHLFILALIGTQMYIWQNFLTDVLNASGHYLHINVSNNLSHLIRVCVLVLLAVTGHLTIGTILFVMGILGPSIVFIRTALSWPAFITMLAHTRVTRETVRFAYTFTYYIASQLYQLATRTDLFLISYYLTRPEVGYYGLSQKILLAVVTSSDSITQVLSPQFAKARTYGDVQTLLKHMRTYMLLPAGMFALGILIPKEVYTLVFSAQYDASTVVTKALSLAYMITPFIAGMLLVFLYTIKKPRYLLISNALLCAIIVSMNYHFIPSLRLFAPAISYGVAHLVVGVFLYSALKYEMRLLPKK